MKNLKKLSRGEMKTIAGGEWGGFACCNFKGQCSAVAIGNSDNMRCVDSGTFLKKIENIKEANTSLSQSVD